MTEPFTNGVNIITVLQKMSSEGMAEGVMSHGLFYLCELSDLSYCLLQYAGIKMVAFLFWLMLKRVNGNESRDESW